MIAEGGAVQFVVNNCVGSEKDTSLMPSLSQFSGRFQDAAGGQDTACLPSKVDRASEMSLIHPSHVMGTEKAA